ncbi:DNA-3-methyladenine glycosylase 2 family protein, partial [Escherichia coli]|nr:DNA-3-methyladenine glycosylase 2 family protein [Escherichia coli]
RVGYPPPRIRDRGHETLLRTIVGQQVSVAAAQSIWNRMAAQLGALTDPATIFRASDEDLRAAGLSRQKVAYARSLAEEVISGRLDFAHLA